MDSRYIGAGNRQGIQIWQLIYLLLDQDGPACSQLNDNDWTTSGATDLYKGY